MQTFVELIIFEQGKVHHACYNFLQKINPTVLVKN